jgi:tRNA modification GTPase
MEKTPPGIICAIATPEGISALSVVRISGKGAVSLVEGVMGLEENRLAGMRRKVGQIRNRGRAVDEVVALSWAEEKSFTGEELVEIICHGIPEIVKEIMEILTDSGARTAEPGEFARRAFGNGRLSAMKVIALASLWETGKREFTEETEESCRALLKEIENTRETIEGNIEFGETHLGDLDEELGSALMELIERAENFESMAVRLEKSRRVLLMGPTNSGKSSLFNILSGEGRALVSEEPGTTRDGSTCSVRIDGREIELSDSAGTDGVGLDRAASEAVIERLDGSETVIWMSIAGGIPPGKKVRERAGQILEIASKSDLGIKQDTAYRLSVSSVTGEGIQELRGLISRAPGSMYLSAAAGRISENIRKTHSCMTEQEYDIAAEHLAEAELEVRRILDRGENIQISVERALAGMCVGK